MKSCKMRALIKVKYNRVARKRIRIPDIVLILKSNWLIMHLNTRGLLRILPRSETDILLAQVQWDSHTAGWLEMKLRTMIQPFFCRISRSHQLANEDRSYCLNHAIQVATLLDLVDPWMAQEAPVFQERAAREKPAKVSIISRARIEIVTPRSNSSQIQAIVWEQRIKRTIAAVNSRQPFHLLIFKISMMTQG